MPTVRRACGGGRRADLREKDRTAGGTRSDEHRREATIRYDTFGAHDATRGEEVHLAAGTRHDEPTRAACCVVWMMMWFYTSMINGGSKHPIERTFLMRHA